MSENAKTFAERYASSRKSFTSQNVIKDGVSSAPKSQENASSSSESPSSNKQIDPFKKMQAELIYLVKGIDAGRNAWYYVLVERLKVQLFLKALNDDIIHLENYGKILYSAYGDEPPSEITNELKEEYGIS